MKTFIYTKSSKPASYCRICTIQVYRVKNNRPIYIGEGIFNSGSTKGEESEAYRVIVDAKQLSRRAYKNAGGYYRDSSDKNFQIWAV